MSSQAQQDRTPQAGVVALLRSRHQIQIEALGAFGKRNLFKLEQICQEAVFTIEAAHGVLTLSDVGEIGKRLPVRSPETRAATFFTDERKAFHTVKTSSDLRWRAT